MTFLGGKATAIFPVGGATGEHLAALLADEQVPVETVETRDWTRQNLHVHVAASGEQYRFVMPGAALTDDEFRRLEEGSDYRTRLSAGGQRQPAAGISVDNLMQLVKMRNSRDCAASLTVPAMRWPPRWTSVILSW